MLNKRVIFRSFYMCSLCNTVQQKMHHAWVFKLLRIHVGGELQCMFNDVHKVDIKKVTIFNQESQCVASNAFLTLQKWVSRSIIFCLIRTFHHVRIINMLATMVYARPSWGTMSEMRMFTMVLQYFLKGHIGSILSIGKHHDEIAIFCFSHMSIFATPLLKYCCFWNAMSSTCGIPGCLMVAKPYKTQGCPYVLKLPQTCSCQTYTYPVRHTPIPLPPTPSPEGQRPNNSKQIN